MPETPLITVGLPVYHTERYLRQSLDSLLAQTFPDFVLVICDNTSTDGTARICEHTPPRIRASAITAMKPTSAIHGTSIG